MLQAAVWVGRMFTATLIALSWHRPSTDFLSLRSRPASLGSRMYFSFVLCFELSVSKLPSFSCKSLINFSQVSISSFFTLRLHRAPAVRLIDSSISRSSTPSTSTSSRLSRSPPPSYPSAAAATTGRSLDPPELLDSLSLSSAPIPLRTRHATGPVFGHPSLRPAAFNPPSPRASSSPTPMPLPQSQSQSRSHSRNEEEDEDAMDWTPTTSPAARPEPASRGLFHARKISDASTGLETLFERTIIIDPSGPGSMTLRTRRGRGSNKNSRRWSWGWVYALSLVPLFGMMYYQLLR